MVQYNATYIRTKHCILELIQIMDPPVPCKKFGANLITIDLLSKFNLGGTFKKILITMWIQRVVIVSVLLNREDVPIPSSHVKLQLII